MVTNNDLAIINIFIFREENAVTKMPVDLETDWLGGERIRSLTLSVPLLYFVHRFYQLPYFVPGSAVGQSPIRCLEANESCRSVLKLVFSPILQISIAQQEKYFCPPSLSPNITNEFDNTDYLLCPT